MVNKANSDSKRLKALLFICQKCFNNLKSEKRQVQICLYSWELTFIKKKINVANMTQFALLKINKIISLFFFVYILSVNH